jgi:sugar phosphate isomerase/epimerase
MARIISFATGNIWRWSASDNPASLLRHLRGLDISGVELTFGSKAGLYAFRPSARDRRWLRGLDRVTVHAPFHLMGLMGEAETEEELMRQLGRIAEICEDLEAREVIIHPDNLPPPETLAALGLPVSTENLPRKGYRTAEDLEGVFERYPEVGLCLDVSHAYLSSRHETERLVRAFRQRITQVHLSGTYRRQDHRPLREVRKAFLQSIEPVRALPVPIVIEEDMKGRDIMFLKEEIAYIRSFFP